MGSNVTSYSNTGLTAGTTYYYRMFATNGVGSSAASNEAGATTPGGGVPVRNGLALWLAGDAGVTTNGSAVAAWADQSGQGRDASQANVSEQPTLVTTSTGKPGIHFNGTGQYLDFTLPLGGLTGMSIVVVSANYPQQNGTAPGWTDPPENSTMIAWPEDSTYGNWDGVYLNSFQTNVYWRFGTTQVPNGYKYSRPVSLGTAASLTTLIKNGTAETLYLNGAQAMQVTTSDSVLDGVGTDARAHLGKATWTATYFAGDIMEVLVFTNAMSTADRISVENYLRNKYLPGLLPAVAITSPTNNASFAASGNIPITATASGGNGAIAKVEFFAGSTLLGTKTSAPYSVTWSNATAGTYNLTARATDTVGAWAVGGAVAVVVAPLSVAIAASGDTVVISWPASAVGFVLETSRRLAAPSWAAVDQTPVVVGDQNRVTLAIGPSTTFFRLSK